MGGDSVETRNKERLKKIKMGRFSEDELLIWLKCRFCNEETPCGGCIRLKQGCREKQAYKQLVELIKNRVA